MLQLELNLDPNIEKQLLETIRSEFNGSYEKFIETALQKPRNILSQLADIAEEFEPSDLAENHDVYLYGVKQ
jgi:hypothetical protein